MRLSINATVEQDDATGAITAKVSNLEFEGPSASPLGQLFQVIAPRETPKELPAPRPTKQR